MVWGLDGLVGSVQGLFSSSKSSTPPSSDPSAQPLRTPGQFSNTSSSSPLSSTLSSNTFSASTAADSTPSSSSPSAATAATAATAAGAAGVGEGEGEPPQYGEGESYWFSARSRRQFAAFAAGAAFVTLSTRLTARALRRKYVQNFPAFYHPSNAPPANAVSAPLEAVEALSVATVNVLSSGLMVAGGLLWAFDISGMADLQRKVRGGLGVDGSGRSEGQAEEDFEEWLAATLDRKKRKEEAVAAAAGSGGELDGLSIADKEEIRNQWQEERRKRS